MILIIQMPSKGECEKPISVDSRRVGNLSKNSAINTFFSMGHNVIYHLIDVEEHTGTSYSTESIHTCPERDYF